MSETLVRLFLFYNKEQQIGKKGYKAYLQYSENSDAILDSCNVLGGWGIGEWRGFAGNSG